MVWTNFLLNQLDRTSLEGIVLGRGLKGCPSKKDEMASFILLDGVEIRGEHEFEAFKLAYRKGYRTDPPDEVLIRSRDTVDDIPVQTVSSSSKDIKKSGEPEDPEEEVVADSVVQDGSLMKERDSKDADPKKAADNMGSDNGMQNQIDVIKANMMAMVSSNEDLKNMMMTMMKSMTSSMDTMRGQVDTIEQKMASTSMGSNGYQNDKNVTMRRNLETPMHGQGDLGNMYTPMEERLHGVEGMTYHGATAEPPSFSGGHIGNDQARQDAWLRLGASVGYDHKKLSVQTPMIPSPDLYKTNRVPVGVTKSPTVVTVASSLKDVATFNEKKARVRINMGYRMPNCGYLESFWLLPPQWQKERPRELPLEGDDSQLSSGLLYFVKRRVDQASAQLVSQIHPLADGPYGGSGDKRGWHAVEREIVDNLDRSCLDFPKVHVDYLLNCVTKDLSQTIKQKLGPNGYRDADQVELLSTVWNIMDELFRSEFTPQAESDKMQNMSKGSQETLPEFMRKLQSAFFNVEVETGQKMVDSTKLTRLRGALPEVDVQFLRSRFPRDLTFDQLVTRVGEYFSNDLDKKSYETFARSYAQLWPTDVSGGYSHANLSVANTQPKRGCWRCNVPGHTAAKCRAPLTKVVSGRCYKCGYSNHSSNDCKADPRKLNCARCHKRGHVASVCRTDWNKINAKTDDKAALPQPPPQPVGEYVTKMQYTTEPSATNSGQQANAVNAESVGTEASTKSEATAATVQTHTINEVNLCSGSLYETLVVYVGQSDQHEASLRGLLDTGASEGFVEESLADAMVKKGGGFLEDLRPPLRVTLADNSLKLLTKRWRCFVKQATVDGQVVWKLLSFNVMANTHHPGLIIGRNQFKLLGYVIGKKVRCDKGQSACVLNNSMNDKMVKRIDSDDISVECCHANVGDACSINPKSNIEFKEYVGRMATLEWRSSKRPSRSYHAAVKRAKRLEYTLNKRGGQALVDSYDEQFKSWLESGFIRPVEDDEVKHYLFHHPVIRVGHPTTPMRPVINGQSLDPFLKPADCNLLQIVDILLQWRQTRKWATMDLSKAFLRIQMRECDQCYLGIYWRHQSYVFNVLPFGLNMSPSWLTANVQTVLQRLGKDPDFNACVLPYMDDLMLMVQEGTDIVVQQRALVERFIEDGFPVATSKTVWYNQEGKAKILGVPWYGGATDCIGVSFKSPKVEPTTRRSVLSMVNGLYDPLGLLLEQEMSGRLLVRDTINYAWDEQLPQDLCERASKWLVATKKIVDAYKIPRLMDCTKLLVYVDASMDAWGVDIRTTDGQRVISQGGLFPTDRRDKWTIPKKELLAMVRGRELLQRVWDNVEIDKKPNCEAIILSDSQLNCYRLHKDIQHSSMKAWELKTVTSLRGWLCNMKVPLRHVVTSWNAADAITRGVYPNRVSTSMVEQTATWWVQRQLDQEAPWGDTISFTQEEVEEVLLIQQAEPIISVAKATVKPKLHEMDDGTYQIIMGKHRRLLQRLRRWRSRVCDINYKDPTEDEVWRSLCQWKQSLCEYINLIKTVITNSEVNNVATRTRRKWKLQYMVKDDLLYRKVRHDQHGQTYLQMVIPESDSLVVALIRRYHVQRAHNGVGDTLQSLLQEVWWKGIKRHVQQYVRGCYICQLVRGQTHPSEPGTMYATPEPWYLVGVDLTGPYTESSDGYRYLLTCTCLYTRYMVVQPIKNMTVDNVLVALKKVCSIYGNPHMIVFDNGVQFISKKFQCYCNENNIHHRLIPRYSPNLGGGYERPHQLLHRGLTSLLLEGERTLTPTAKEWVDYLDDILWVINTRTLHYKKTGSISPFELMMARKPRMGELPKRVNRDQWQTVTKIPSTTVVDKQRQKVREQLQQRFIPVWESMREKSRETVISKASKYPHRELREGDYAWIFKKKSHKLDLPWKGPYEVLRVDGVKVSLKLDDQHTIVDSYDHVLKVERPWTLTKTTKGGLIPGTVIIFGDAEIGIVESSRGNDTLLHMVRATPHYSTAYYLQRLYWNPKTGSIVGESLKDSNFGGYKISAGCNNGNASGKEEWLPLLRAHSFKKGGGQRSLQRNYQVLNVREDGYLTRRSATVLQEWCKIDHSGERGEVHEMHANAAVAAMSNEEKSLADCNCLSLGNDDCEQPSGSLVVADPCDYQMSEIIAKFPCLRWVFTVMNTNRPQAVSSEKKPNADEIKKLWQECVIYCNKNLDGVSVTDHYSLLNEWEGFTDLIKGYFKFDGNDVSVGDLNDVLWERETVLPSVVRQLRKNGLNGGYANNKFSVEVYGPIIEPSIVMCTVALIMRYGVTPYEAMKLIREATEFVANGQCMCCPPYMQADGKGHQWVSSWVGNFKDEHCGSDTHKEQCTKIMSYTYRGCFYGVLQAMVEGSRLAYKVTFSDYNEASWVRDRYHEGAYILI